MSQPFDIVILGLTVTSSWGNGHAVTYRGLIRGLAARGHRVLFLERDAPWYAGNRDQPQPQGAVTKLYDSFEELTARFESAIRDARLVIVGSYVREGIRVGEWVTSVARGRTAFYDIDTPVTLSHLADGDLEYLTPALVSRYNLYLSFTGGPALTRLENDYGSPMARALYCTVDPDLYRPQQAATQWDLGYLGTYSKDRQPGLESLLLDPAREWPEGRFMVAGPMYPETLEWPANVQREIHLSPGQHAAFYAAQRFTLNITRVEMKKAGYSPSVRLFEAGGCAVAIISDWWKGLDELFTPGKEILISESADDTLRYLRDIPDHQRRQMGEAARARVLAEHTPEHRARQLESYLKELDDNVSAHQARANGRDRKGDRGLATGLEPQQRGPGAVPSSVGAAEPSSDRGSLHEPVGTGHGNRAADRTAAPTRVTPAE